MHSYIWSGLKVDSGFELKDLQRWTEPTGVSDGVRLTMGKVPTDLPQSNRVDDRQQVAGPHYLFHRAGVASYLVSEGKHITMAPEPSVPQASVAAFLMGRPFAALACQRGWLSLHGGCLLTGAQGTVIAAPAGSGKSTLLAALQSRGHALVSDDSAVVRFENGVPWVWPTSQRLRLKTDAAQRFPQAAGAIEAVRPGLDKVAVPFLKAASVPVRLHQVLFLRRQGDRPLLTPVDRLETLDLLSNHLNRPRLADLILGSRRRFQQVAQLAEQIECHHLSVPDDLGRLDEVAAMIASRFG